MIKRTCLLARDKCGLCFAVSIGLAIYASSTLAHASTLNDHITQLAVQAGWAVLVLGALGGLMRSLIRLYGSKYVPRPFSLVALDAGVGMLAGVGSLFGSRWLNLETEQLPFFVFACAVVGRELVERAAPNFVDRVAGSKPAWTDRGDTPSLFDSGTDDTGDTR